MLILPGGEATWKPEYPRLRVGHPLASNLCGAYLFQDSARNFALPGFRNGTLGSAASFFHDRWGSAISLPGGADSYVDLGGNFGEGALGVGFSIVGRFRQTVNVFGDDAFFGRYNGTQLFVLSFYKPTGADPTVRALFGISPFTGIVSTTPLAAGTWNTFAFVFDGSVGRLYSGGPDTLVLEATSSAVAGAFTASTAYRFGMRGGDNADPFSGSFDYLYFFDRALSGPELSGFVLDPFAPVRPRRFFPTRGTPPPAATVALAGSLGITGAATFQGGDTVALAGVLPITAAASFTATVPSATVALAGTVGITGSAAFTSTLPAATVALAGSLGITGSASFTATVPSATVNLAGTLGITAAAAFKGGNTVALAGVVGITGAAAFTGTVPAATAALAGVLPITAAATFSAAPPGGASVGLAGVLSLTAAASLTTTMPAATLALAGVVGLTGSASFTGVVPVATVTLAGVLPITAAATFTVAPPGGSTVVLAGVLPITAAASFTTTAPAASVALAGVVGLTGAATFTATAPPGPATIALAGVLDLSGHATFATTGGPLTFLKNDPPRFARPLACTPRFARFLSSTPRFLIS